MAVSNHHLRLALEAALLRQGALPGPIISLVRRPSPYSSSYPLEELSVTFADGQRLALMFKNLSPAYRLPGAAQAKPAFLINPLREVALYQEILTPQSLSTPRLFGAHVNVERDEYWLFLERVPGVELYQVGDLAVWESVAAWLAETQGSWGHGEAICARAGALPLLQYDARWYRLWLQRARAFVAQRPTGPAARSQLEWLAQRYERLVETLAALPTTLIHGEFYASNILVVDHVTPLRVCPVDWEMAGLGPGILDLAALVAGSWPDEQRDAIISAYYAALEPVGHWGLTPASFRWALACCRIHMAVQWLGWSPTWAPPAAHAQDWLGEAIGVAEAFAL